jgi:hypothetical protein
MADTTAAAQRANISSAFATYIGELKQAGPVWEAKPASATEGEDAWCARQVAEHIAGSGLFFGAGIAGLIGVPAPALDRASLDSAAAAVSKTEDTHGQLVAVIDQVKDAQLGIEVDHPALGKQTVGSLMGIVAYHLNDHAQQLKTLRGG